MLRVVIGLGLLVLAGPAWAGCSSGDEPGPRAEICVNGKCETTRIEIYCANAFFAAANYENGVIIHREEGGDWVAKDDARLSMTDVVCKEVDEGACDLFEFKASN